jgi:ATP-dependent Lon protease
MAEISIKDYKIYNLEQKYEKISDYLYKLSIHINNLYENFIIIANVKNINLNNINDLIKKLNTIYNTNILNIHIPYNDNNDNNDNNNDDNYKINTKIYDDLHEITNYIKNMNINDNNNVLAKYIINDPYLDIKNDILNVCSNIGCISILYTLDLLIDSNYKKIIGKDNYKLLQLYDKLFVCFKFNKINTIYKSHLYFRKSDLKKDILINNCYSLYIRISDTASVELFGYFIEDPLNITIRTSQKCNNILYQKKKKIDNMVYEKHLIDEKFYKSYIKNCHIRYLLVFSEDEFIELLLADYNKYLQIIKCSFINLMKDFIKDDIYNMYIIIKLLLLGSSEHINMAGLLYGLTKDKKIGGNVISLTIYKNLSYMEQLKIKKTNVSIKNELERIKSLTIEDIDLKKQIIALKNMPDNIKLIAIEKTEEMKSSNNEYYKQQLFVKTLCKFPWISADDNKIYESLHNNNLKSIEYLNNIDINLDKYIFGHNNAKKELKQLVGKWISNPNSSGTALSLVGPPGVGKTLFAKGISKALNIPFVQISLGGHNDGELLYGHGYTYSGAQPGMVVKKMIEAGNSRCVLYFDELDKTSIKNGHTNEIMSILIHMTDPNMNTEFQDRFFQGINFPLNNVLMCFSYNDRNLIDRILLDRLNEIKVESYTCTEKIKITQYFIMKEMAENMGYDKSSIIIQNDENPDCFIDGKQKEFRENCLNHSNNCSECITLDDLNKYKNIEFIIEKYTMEAGVRELKRCIEKIFLKMNIDKIYRQGIFTNADNLNNPVIIDRETIIKYLDKPHLNIEKIHSEPLVGVINGLYATAHGSGGIVPIQIYKNYTGDDKSILKITGSQKDIMKESVMCALTAATNLIDKDIRDQLLQNFPNGFHIHTPDGATPKDGPSAGCAFTTAFISRILDKKIKNNIGMTGEIDLTGKVTKIGGLLYKLIGAKKAGITHVFCSIENKEDYDNIIEKHKKLIDDNFKVSFVTTVTEICLQVIIGIKQSDLTI